MTRLGLDDGADLEDDDWNDEYDLDGEFDGEDADRSFRDDADAANLERENAGDDEEAEARRQVDAELEMNLRRAELHHVELELKLVQSEEEVRNAKEALQKAEAEREAVKRRAARKRAREELPDEPPIGTPGTTRLRVRLPDGTVLTRTFLLSATVAEVYAWLNGAPELEPLDDAWSLQLPSIIASILEGPLLPTDETLEERAVLEARREAVRLDGEHRRVLEVGDQLDPAHGASIDGHWDSVLEAHHDLDRAPRCVGGVLGHQPCIVWRLGPEVLHLATLNRTTPEVLIDGVRLLLGDWDRNSTLDGVVHLEFACGELPLPKRGDDPEFWGEGFGGEFEANLVVAFAGASVSNGVGTVFQRHLDEARRQEWSSERSVHRVHALVQCAGSNCRPDELFDESVGEVINDRVTRSRVECLVLDGSEVFPLAEVTRIGDDLGTVVLREPWDHDRGVQTAGVGAHDLLVLLAHFVPHEWAASVSQTACWGCVITQN